VNVALIVPVADSPEAAKAPEAEKLVVPLARRFLRSGNVEGAVPPKVNPPEALTRGGGPALSPTEKPMRRPSLQVISAPARTLAAAIRRLRVAAL
jgi:hypothetical protein